jgi:hypothetical protein
MSVLKYKSNLAAGARVLFREGEHHPKNGQHCTILGALANPSQRSENQWYDVRFEDQSLGRFNERFLHTDSADGRSNVA